MSEQLIQLIGDYGPLALFGILAVNSAGVPFPTTLLLLALGSFVGQGEMAFWPLLLWGLAGVVLGDNAGYLLGRLGGEAVSRRLASRPRAAAGVARAERLVRRWGGPGVFFSRWLLSPLGPWVNLATGSARYPWPRFAVWDLLGGTLWVGLYLGLGLVFSRSVHNLAVILGHFTWFLVFALAAALLGWRLLTRLRAAGRAAAERAGSGPDGMSIAHPLRNPTRIGRRRYSPPWSRPR